MPRRIVILAGAILFAVAGALVAKRFVAADALPVSRESTSAPSGSALFEGHLATIEALEESGDSLESERPVDFFLDFQTEATARAAGEELGAEGFAIDVYPLEDGSGRWSVTAVRNLAPKREVISETNAILIRIADKHWGTYDGWGCEVIRDSDNP